jgi:hypothetical protein
MTFLRRILFADAGSCVGLGLFLALLADPLSPMLGLPAALLFIAGLALLPIAAFISWVASREQPPAGGVWLVILGNAGWVAGSVALLFFASPTALGYAFVIGQAAIVAGLAELEYFSIRAGRAGSASA